MLPVLLLLAYQRNLFRLQIALVFLSGRTLVALVLLLGRIQLSSNSRCLPSNSRRVVSQLAPCVVYSRCLRFNSRWCCSRAASNSRWCCSCSSFWTFTICVNPHPPSLSTVAITLALLRSPHKRRLLVHILVSHDCRLKFQAASYPFSGAAALKAMGPISTPNTTA